MNIFLYIDINYVTETLKNHPFYRVFLRTQSYRNTSFFQSHPLFSSGDNHFRTAHRPPHPVDNGSHRGLPEEYSESKGL